jgi:uncharacterized protein (TIGR02453 family)
MIQKETISFLKNLSVNNNKEWFDKNRTQYDYAKNAHIEFINQLIASIAKFDNSVKHLTAKECLFRINRDVRFSKNKNPYKNNFGASISPGGKKSNTAGYYLHIQPNESFIAGGMWQPPTPQLNAIRQEIDYNSVEFKKIIGNKNFIKQFGTLSQEDKLKTVPKGYDKSHPEIELLKHKSYIVFHNYTDKEVLSKDFLKICSLACKDMFALNTFLRKACD